MAYTGAIAGGMLLLFFFIKWSIPVKSEPPVEEFIEINLGSSDVGMGTSQPLLPGAPAPEQASSAPARSAPSTAEAVKDISNEHETSNEAPPVIKPAVSNPNATKVNAEDKVVKNPNPQPAEPQPQLRRGAQMGQVRGGTGPGGNGADTYRPGTGEGNGNRPGDQGSPGGQPGGRRLSAQIVSIPPQYFTDDFKESGTIALDVVVNENGKLVSAAYQVSGSSLPKSSTQYNIALRRVREINFPKYDGGFKQKLTMRFDVK